MAHRFQKRQGFLSPLATILMHISMGATPSQCGDPQDFIRLPTSSFHMAALTPLTRRVNFIHN